MKVKKPRPTILEKEIERLEAKVSGFVLFRNYLFRQINLCDILDRLARENGEVDASILAKMVRTEYVEQLDNILNHGLGFMPIYCSLKSAKVRAE